MLLTTSIIVNVLLWKAGERQMKISELYSKEIDTYTKWISDWRIQVFKTYSHMKMLDDKEIFSKDDEVGVVFKEMIELIKSLNDKTEETTEE